MKNTLYILICLLTLSCTKKEVGNTMYSTNSKKAYLLLTENTTKEELIKISADFKQTRNIDIDFSKTTYYNNGKVKNINLEVDCNDGYKGVAKNFGKTFDINNCGFVRDYSENAEAKFEIGNLNDFIAK